MFKENVTAGFPEVSKLIDSAVSKRQEDQMKYSFFSEKKKDSMKVKIDSLWTTGNIISPAGSCYEAMDSSVS